MDRGACQATVRGVTQSRDTERLTKQFATVVLTVCYLLLLNYLKVANFITVCNRILT